MRRLLALVLVALSVGCTRAPDAPHDATLPTSTMPDAPVFLAASPAALARLPVSLEVADRWIAPNDTVLANATARASSYEWYLGLRNPLVRVADEGPVALARGDAATLDVRRVGRHVFGLEGRGAQLNVSVLDGAIPLRLEARLVDDGAGVRFAPDELVGGRGSTVTIVSDVASSEHLHRLDDMIALAATGASIRFKLLGLVPELGDYDLIVVARDGAGAVGQASARLIFDNRKPDADQTFGPFEGDFQLPQLPAGGGPARFAFRSPFVLRALDVRFNATSPLPVPPGVRVSLVGPEGKVVASAESDGFRAPQLPAGEYAIVVEQTAGAQVHYAVEARGVWQLEAPKSFFRD